MKFFFNQFFLFFFYISSVDAINDGNYDILIPDQINVAANEEGMDAQIEEERLQLRDFLDIENEKFQRIEKEDILRVINDVLKDAIQFPGDFRRLTGYCEGEDKNIPGTEYKLEEILKDLPVMLNILPTILESIKVENYNSMVNETVDEHLEKNISQDEEKFRRFRGFRLRSILKEIKINYPNIQKVYKEKLKNIYACKILYISAGVYRTTEMEGKVIDQMGNVRYTREEIYTILSRRLDRLRPYPGM